MQDRLVSWALGMAGTRVLADGPFGDAAPKCSTQPRNDLYKWSGCSIFSKPWNDRTGAYFRGRRMSLLAAMSDTGDIAKVMLYVLAGLGRVQVEIPAAGM